MKENNIKIVILAAGKGKRMQSDLPKVLIPLLGRPMITHLLESVREAFQNDKPIAVVGHKKKLVEATLGDLCSYSLQENQMGTGHAVSCAKDNCEGAEHIIVLSGDQPFIKTETVSSLAEKHLSSGAKITLATTEPKDFEDWRKTFINFGRVLRESEKIIGIREFKDASEEEKRIKEVNAGCYMFNARWLWENLKNIKNENSQKEYYLTDLFYLASQNKEKIETIKIEPSEALGANTREEFEILEKFALIK